MPIKTHLPAVERPQFFDGERLTAGDLLDAQSYERDLRWLHNRCLHPWGVAVGLPVTGARGDKAATVGAGYALDCRGRDLIVADPVTLQVPPVAGDGKGGAVGYLLTASYLDDAGLPAETRAGVCGESGAVRLPERALVRWQTTADVNPDTRYRPGLDVVLAAISVKGCKLAAPPSLDSRQEASVSTPYVAAGQTEAGATAWSLWPGAAAPLGVSTAVTTSAAGFSGQPRYQAEVVGARQLSGLTVDGFVHVANADASSFDVCVVLPPGPASGGFNPPEVFTAAFLDRLAGDFGWSVSWVGVEG